MDNVNAYNIKKDSPFSVSCVALTKKQELAIPLLRRGGRQRLTGWCFAREVD
jgi:hypothetical protein